MKIITVGNECWLCGHAENEIHAGWFSVEWWRGRSALLGDAPGRGTTAFVQDGRRELALRHYRRGGLIGKLVSDCYLWAGLERSRPWREFRLLAVLFEQGLPVPRPVAARCVRVGLCYRADLITERLPGCPLAEHLSNGPLSATTWRAVGACIARFHRAGVYHADLNARNILLDEAGLVSLLDFDQGDIRCQAGRWQGQNLGRLLRSLEKFRRRQAGFAFSAADWQELLNGYEEGEGA